MLWLRYANYVNICFEASCGAGAQSVTVKSTSNGCDPHSRLDSLHFFTLVSRQSAALNSATQQAIPRELDGKWGTECLNTRFPSPILLCAGYSAKLI